MGCSVCMLKLCCCFRISCAICWPFLEHNSPECSDHTSMCGGAGDGFCVSEARVGPANRRLQQRRQRSSDQTPAQRTGRLEVRQCGAISRYWWGVFFFGGRGSQSWFSQEKLVIFPSLIPGVRLYHTVTPIPGVGAVVFGGRSSPLNPVRSLFKMTFSLCGAPGALESGGQDAPKLCMEEMMCTGSPPPPRWRHSATLTRHRGEGKQEVL